MKYLLSEEEDNNSDELLQSDSELEDHLSEDDVQSDFEDDFVDCQNVEKLENNQNEEDLLALQTSAPPETSTPSETSERDARIIVGNQRVRTGKNRHCWSTNKDRAHERTSAVNIIRTARGPRMCRNIFDSVFITDEILQEIVR